MDHDQMIDVIIFAKAAHYGVVRDDGRTPYIQHPMVVAAAVAAVGGSDEAVAAAWLHDVIEDTPVKPSDLIALFGSDITSIVLELTFPSNMPDRRKRMIERAATMSDNAKLVKLADVFANMVDLPSARWTRDKVQRYYSHLTKMRQALAGTCPALESAFDREALNVKEFLNV